MKKLMLSVFAFSMLVTCYPVNAADKYAVGFNEEFISGYFQSIGQNCSECPTNTVTTSYESVNNLIYDLIANQHVGSYREIVPVALIEQDRVNSNYSNIIAIMQIYSAYNLNLDLALGLPIPSSMSVNGNDYRIMPNDDASWNTLKNSLSYSMGNLLNAMWNSPSISRQWMSTKLFVEGFNEFDALQDLSGSSQSSSPARAVGLTWGINSVINQYSISVQQTTPSVIGNFYFYSTNPPTSQPDPVGRFLSDFYAQGGIGLPNVHLYIPTSGPGVSYQTIINILEQRVLAVAQAVPSYLAYSIILGETGHADVTATYCPAQNSESIDSTQRASEYVGIASDPAINNFVARMTFWRLLTVPVAQLPPDQGCEASFGVLPYNGPYYNQVGLNLFDYLKSP